MVQGGNVRGLFGPPSLKICHWQIFRALRALLLRARGMIPLDPNPRWEMGERPDNLREFG